MSETVPEAIPLVNEASFMLTWAREAGRKDPILFLSEGDIEGTQGRDYQRSRPERYDTRGRFIHRRARLQIDGKRRLIMVNGEERTELATFCGNRRGLRTSVGGDGSGCFLLNGNGFPDQLRQGVQARLRDRINRLHGAQNVLVAPYDALQAAEIDLESIVPIVLAAEGHIPRTRTFRRLPLVPRDVRDRRSNRENTRHEGMAWQVERNWDGSLIWQVNFQPPNGTPGWYRVDNNNTITYREHTLGGAVFWATSPHGRHRYISSFDMQENPPMYFLAQLPEEPEISTMDEAVTALAPPIVQKAWQDDRRVARHGDIFFIRTGLHDVDISMRGKIRRRKVIQQLVRGGRGGGSRIVERVRGRGTNIFGTGHTADFLAVSKEGVVFAKGTVRHEPGLVEPGREPEHADIQLGDDWYLCVRNTVPSA